MLSGQMSKPFEDIYRSINYDLVNHYNQGVSDERERIIKLLEAEQLRSGIGFIQYKVAIPLIKGENK